MQKLLPSGTPCGRPLAWRKTRSPNRDMALRRVQLRDSLYFSKVNRVGGIVDGGSAGRALQILMLGMGPVLEKLTKGRTVGGLFGLVIVLPPRMKLQLVLGGILLFDLSNSAAVMVAFESCSISPNLPFVARAP